MASDEMIQVLRNRGVFAYGQESDIGSIADDWEEYDFSPDQADSWLSAGCFVAFAAHLMEQVGISPEEASKHYDQEGHPGIQIGYAVANADLSVEEAKKIIEAI